MKKIIVIQHTQSEQHINGRIGSWEDWELTEKGVEQAHRIGSRLAAELGDEPYTVYSSDLRRAEHTAKIVAGYLHTSLTCDDRLREIHLGKANGQPKEWARGNLCCPVWPGTVDWADTADGIVFQGAESRREVWRRVSRFVDEVIAPSGGNFMIVSHSGTVSVLLAIWLGMDIEWLDRFLLAGKAGGVSFLREDDEGHRMILRLSDMSYIR